MIQFHKSRNPENPIQNVVFYGDTTEYIRLTNALEGMDISTSLLGVPNNISGYENIEFQAYANAIGAMFRSNKDTDRINLLETDSSSGKTDAGSSFLIGLGGAVVLSAAVVAAVVFGITNAINNNDAKVAEIDEWINSPEVMETLTAVDSTQAKIDKVALYKADLDTAAYNFDTKSALTVDVLNTVIKTIQDNSCSVAEIAYASGSFEISCTAKDNTAPDEAVKAIYDLDMFDNIVYDGFQSNGGGEAVEGAAQEDPITFTVSFVSRPNEVEVEETAETTDETQEEGVE